MRTSYALNENAVIRRERTWIRTMTENVYMTKPYMFLTCVIPGPFNPTVCIYVYLQPLIDDLKKLWSGVMTYDVSRKQNFMMRATLVHLDVVGVIGVLFFCERGCYNVKSSGRI